MASWLPFVRAAAVGWIPIAANPLPSYLHDVGFARAAAGSSSSGPDRVRINVSGQVFETWRHVLDKFPTTLLGSDERDYFYDSTRLFRRLFLIRDVTVSRPDPSRD